MNECDRPADEYDDDSKTGFNFSMSTDDDNKQIIKKKTLSVSHIRRICVNFIHQIFFRVKKIPNFVYYSRLDLIFKYISIQANILESE